MEKQDEVFGDFNAKIINRTKNTPFYGLIQNLTQKLITYIPLLSVVVEKAMNFGLTTGWLDIADIAELLAVEMNDILGLQCKGVDKQ